MGYFSDSTIDSGELDAYNGAFWDLGLRWQWDAKTFSKLSRVADEHERVSDYIKRHQSHLLVAYDADTLARVIVENKRQRQAAVQAARRAGRRAELTCAGVLEA
ncbi:MAG TPA: hypothetical protein VNT02_12250 [Burkholderiales bacterium]|nr:hypothetical protein [Burkholderiales bacterium]